MPKTEKEPPMNHIHILFVDDEPDTLSAINRQLYRENYILHFAECGDGALAVMSEFPIHVLVTDMKMPGMDGLTLLRHVKERYPHTVRLALSAYLQIDVLLHCINTGEIYRYITKPIKPAELKQALRDAADFFRMREDHVSLLRELQRKNEKLEQALVQEKKAEQLLREKQVELENRNDKLRRAQAELEISNARYLDLYDQAPVGYCTIGENGMILEANLTAINLLCIPGEELLHHPVSRFVAESDQDVYNLNLKLLFDTGEPRGCDLRMVRNDAKEFWVHLAANQFRLQDGTPVCRAAITDITKRIAAEKALEDELVQRRMMFEQSPYGIVIVDPGTNGFIDFNTVAHRQLGYSREEFSRLRISDIDAGETPEETAARMAAMILGGRADFETAHRTRQGEIRYVHVTAQLLRLKKNTVIYSTYHDITDRRRAEKEIQDANRFLKEATDRANQLAIEAHTANRAKSNFLAVMSHEIRTPLNGIIGMTNIVLESELNREHRDHLSLVKESSEALLSLINDILDYSKIEAGKMELEFSDFQIREGLEQTLRFLSAKAKEKNVGLTHAISQQVPETLKGDPGRLRQILFNLVGNAVKFTQEGQITVIVDVASRTGDEVELKVEVRDTGIGISSEKLKVIFDPFTQADSFTTRHYGGTGLGLSITAQLVGLMNGRIWCESRLGIGTVFYFTCRLGICRENMRPGAPQPLPGDGSEIPFLHPLHVLLAEDNPVNQKMISLLLVKNGHTVQMAGNGMETVESYRSGRFDIILMDVQMPQMDGLEATRRIRRLELDAGGRIPIVALTANAFKKDEEDCLAAGMDAYLSKPVSKALLFQTIHQLLFFRNPLSNSK